MDSLTGCASVALVILQGVVASTLLSCLLVRVFTKDGAMLYERLGNAVVCNICILAVAEAGVVGLHLFFWYAHVGFRAISASAGF